MHHVLLLETGFFATLDDYAAVRALIADAFAEGIESTVPLVVRETVDAVAQLNRSGEGVGLNLLAEALQLDKSSVSRRAKRAQKLGYLRNREMRRGQTAKYEPADLLPDEIEVLPTPQRWRTHCSLVPAGQMERPPSPTHLRTRSTATLRESLDKQLGRGFRESRQSRTSTTRRYSRSLMKIRRAC